MNNSRFVGVVFALSLGALAACSSSAQQAGPASTTSVPPSAPSTSASASPSSPTTTSYSLANLPDEGRNLASCEDGHCRITVKPGDRIPVPVSLGGTTIVIKSIEQGWVTVQQEGTGNPAGPTTFTFYEAATGSGLISGQKLSLAFPRIDNGQAVMQVDV